MTRITLHPPASSLGAALSSETALALSAAVDLAQRQLTQKKLCLGQTREQLGMLDAQIKEFLADKSVPGRNAGIFLCRMATELRTMADELDGRSA